MQVVAKKCRKSWCVNAGNDSFLHAVCKHLRALLIATIRSSGFGLFFAFKRSKSSRSRSDMGMVRGAASVFVPGRKAVPPFKINIAPKQRPFFLGIATASDLPDACPGIGEE